MISFLTALALIPALWPVIETFVKAVENPEIPGSEKQVIVLEALEQVFNGIGSIPGVTGKVAFTTIKMLAIPIINTVVFILNKTGVFKKKESQNASFDFKPDIVGLAE